MGPITEQASGGEAMKHFQDNYVPQEGGPESAQEYLMQNPETAAAIEKQAAGYTSANVRGKDGGFTSDGALYENRTEAIGAQRAARDARVVDVMRVEDPEKAARLEQQQMQGRASAIQLKNAEAEQGATKVWGLLSEKVKAGEMNEADRYSEMIAWGSKNGMGFKPLQQWEADRKNALEEGAGEVFAVATAIRAGKIAPDRHNEMLDKAFDKGELRGYKVQSFDPKTGDITAVGADGETVKKNVDVIANSYMKTSEILKIQALVAETDARKANTKYLSAKAGEAIETGKSLREARVDRADREEIAVLDRSVDSAFGSVKDINSRYETRLKNAVTDDDRKAVEKSKEAELSTRGLGSSLIIDKGLSSAQARFAAEEVAKKKVSPSGMVRVGTDGKVVYVGDILGMPKDAKR